MATDLNKIKTETDIPEKLVKTYLAQDEVAVDVELQGLKLWRDQVCLVQLCDGKGNVCLVQIKAPQLPPNLERLLKDPSTLKIFHYALSDVSFFKSSLNVEVHPYRCTKIMSKLARTYTNSHSLKSLVGELVGVELSKEEQSTDWSGDITQKQMHYAACDVVYLVQVYKVLEKMIGARGKLPSGISLDALNEKSQQSLPAIVELLLNGYGDRDQGWETSLFAH